jgi:hypothetical protein
MIVQSLAKLQKANSGHLLPVDCVCGCHRYLDVSSAKTDSSSGCKFNGSIACRVASNQVRKQRFELGYRPGGIDVRQTSFKIKGCLNAEQGCCRSALLTSLSKFFRFKRKLHLAIALVPNIPTQAQIDSRYACILCPTFPKTQTAGSFDPAIQNSQPLTELDASLSSPSPPARACRLSSRSPASAPARAATGRPPWP